MADKFQPNTFDIDDINNGDKFTAQDGITPEAINAPIESALFMQKLGTNQPDVSEANGVGTAKVEIVMDESGNPKFKFFNIKGEKGEMVRKVVKEVRHVDKLEVTAVTGNKELTVESIIFPDGVESAVISTCGKNMFDMAGQTSNLIIKNDNGVEVYDGVSSYYLKKIPVIPSETLYFNFGVQRIYQYDAQGKWLRRTASRNQASAMGSFIVPEDCYSIQIQIGRASGTINIDKAQCEVGVTGTDYEAYNGKEIEVNSTTTLPLHGFFIIDGGTRVGCDVDALFTISYMSEDIEKIQIPACEVFDLWEPASTTNDYTVPIGRNNVTIDLKYYDFLSLYFDKYLGRSNDYTVLKYSLGTDSSGHYDVITYDFIPKHYNRTILISAGMNACELSPMWGLAYFIKAIMEQYNEDNGLKYIRENVRIKVIPVLCPWSFDQSPMKYPNSNGVRINKNFNYKNSWNLMETSDSATRGGAPDSEVEVHILKKWLNDNANMAELWIDAHCDPDFNPPMLNCVFCSHSELLVEIEALQSKIRKYYVEKGTYSDSDTFGYVTTAKLNNYPKTIYAHEVCDIDAIMIEQFPCGTAYGGDGSLANDDADIRNYVLMLRAYILSLLKRNEKTYTAVDSIWFEYQTKLEAKKIGR